MSICQSFCLFVLPSSHLLFSSSVSPTTCTFVCLSIYPWACQSIHLSIHKIVCLSACLSTCLSACLSACLPACLPSSMYASMVIHLSIHKLSVCLYFYPSLHSYICLSVCLFVCARGHPILRQIVNKKALNCFKTEPKMQNTIKQEFYKNLSLIRGRILQIKNVKTNKNVSKIQKIDVQIPAQVSRPRNLHDL